MDYSSSFDFGASISPIGSIFAIFFGAYAIWDGNRQRKKSQEPYITLYDNLPCPPDDRNISVKNIGPGYAYKIQIFLDNDFTKDITDPTQPHMRSLGPDKSENILVNRSRIDYMLKKGPVRVFVSYSDSFDRKYVSSVSFKVVGKNIQNIGDHEYRKTYHF